MNKKKKNKDIIDKNILKEFNNFFSYLLDDEVEVEKLDFIERDTKVIGILQNVNT